ncbi:hypothetical protein AAES_103495 [Amazona aestiva]|uniref:Uncharacterized protein n=1 Tax=Amazona aestiva TaxID=12930 RepID=A0A0Q3TG29_AMAAE|nr:hypothetical protein AAES_103495 [Amazona aestiva]
MNPCCYVYPPPSKKEKGYRCVSPGESGSQQQELPLPPYLDPPKDKGDYNFVLSSHDADKCQLAVSGVPRGLEQREGP